MRLFVLFVLLVSVVVLSGCAAQQDQVQSTGQSVNLWPSSHEQRAGQ
jgi:uncharacterized lipoprotein YajG